MGERDWQRTKNGRDGLLVLDKDDADNGTKMVEYNNIIFRKKL